MILAQDDLFLFVHIPKTGGSTLMGIIRNKFGFHETCPQQELSEWLYYGQLGYRAYLGHFPNGIMRRYLDRPLHAVTILRDPVERVLSDYSHHLRNANTPMPEHRKAYQRRFHPNMSLEEYLSEEGLRRSASNQQTYYLSGNFGPDDFATAQYLTRHDPKTLMKLHEPLSADKAIAALHEFSCFGIMEQYNQFVDLLTYTFNWEPMTEIRQANVSPSRPKRDTIAPHLVERIIELNQEDYKLYNYAKQAFEQNYESMVKTLLENRYHQHLLSISTPEAAIDFTFDRPIPGIGWHIREENPEYGYYCWTGPETSAHLDFVLGRNQDWQIQFRVLHALQPEIKDSLALYINGQPLTLKQHNGVYTGKIPKRLITSRPTRLTFEVAATISPQDLSLDSNDDRRLGVSINWVKLTPC